MTWLVWRQHRLEIVLLLATSVCLAVAAIVLWDFDYSQRTALGVDTCVPLPGGNANCVALQDQLRFLIGPWIYLIAIFYAGPALMASYLGGPLLSRDLERGLHRLVWTIGSSRVRWAATKLALMGVAIVAATAALALTGRRAADVWSWGGGARPFDSFDLDGIVVVAYGVFGLALAAFIGAASRRIFTGMFAGLLAFVLVRTFVAIDLRPNYVPPVIVPFEIPRVPPYDATPGVPRDAWNLGLEAVDARGNQVPRDQVQRLINEYSATSHTSGDSETYLHEHGIFQRWRYQPAERYPLFQAIESSLFAVLASALIAATLFLVRRRDA